MSETGSMVPPPFYTIWVEGREGGPLAEKRGFLLENGKVKESQLTAVVKNYYTAVDVAAKLVDNNLVDSWMEKDGHTVKVYELTALG